MQLSVSSLISRYKGSKHKLIIEQNKMRLKPSTKATSSEEDVRVVPNSRVENIKSQATRRACQDRMKAFHLPDNLVLHTFKSDEMGWLDQTLPTRWC
jgi:hypothetical protein